jgi:hypothetical protein
VTTKNVSGIDPNYRYPTALLRQYVPKEFFEEANIDYDIFVFVNFEALQDDIIAEDHGLGTIGKDQNDLTLALTHEILHGLGMTR